MDLSRLFAPDDGRDALRTLAGLLLGLGFFMAWARKSGAIIGGWGDWGLFITLLIITVFLYGVGIVGRLSTSMVRAWQGVYLVFGIILVPFLLFQFLDAINATSTADLNVFWVLLVTAAAAAFAALAADVRYGMLLTTIALIGAFSALFDKILSNGLIAHYGIYRGLLVLYGLVFLVLAIAVYRLDPFARLRPGGPTPEPERWLRAQDVITGAALSAVLAGSITFTAFFAQTNSLFAPPVASSSLLWDLELLVASLLAVIWGARFAVRGPTYVGAIGLFVFLVDVGSEVGIASPESTIVGWPLILAIVGAVLFIVSLMPDVTTPDAEATLRGTAGPGPEPPPGPAPPPGPGPTGGAGGLGGTGRTAP